MPSTFFSIQLQLPGEIRAFQAEGEIPQTAAETLVAIGELPKGWRVLRVLQCDYDTAPRDVTEDLARRAWRDWRDAGNDPAHDRVPQFLSDCAPADIDLGYCSRAA